MRKILYVLCILLASLPVFAQVTDEAAAGYAGLDPDKIVNVNTATIEQLMLLPRIGKVTAQEIIDYRTEHGDFKTIEALEDVPRIGPKTLELLKLYVALNGETTLTTKQSPPKPCTPQ